MKRLPNSDASAAAVASQLAVLHVGWAEWEEAADCGWPLTSGACQPHGVARGQIVAALTPRPKMPAVK